jgi:hypothetical protein
MRSLNFLYAALLAATSFLSSASALRSDKVKLSNVQSLTFRKGMQTSHRRVSAIPQVHPHPSTSSKYPTNTTNTHYSR